MMRYFLRILNNDGENVAPTTELEPHRSYTHIDKEPDRFVQAFVPFYEAARVDYIEIRNERGEVECISTSNLPRHVEAGGQLRVSSVYRNAAIARQHGAEYFLRSVDLPRS